MLDTGWLAGQMEYQGYKCLFNSGEIHIYNRVRSEFTVIASLTLLQFPIP
jgi:hypothetical protein